jgi:tRNA U34 5-methylaminomethyl-2-thiouridine-forming methyltransferase MnmC
MASDIKIILTADGSHTLYDPILNETFHSAHGAIRESAHVYIKNGLDYVLTYHEKKEPLRILEVGFGTGLNALLTLLAIQDNAASIHYTTLEPFPLDAALLEHINYHTQLGPEAKKYWDAIHLAPWEIETPITTRFNIHKMKATLLKSAFAHPFDLVYYDAFGPRKQPEMWTQENFDFLHTIMKPNSAMVTYCAQGQFKRNLAAAGFELTILKGPPYKLEMVRGLLIG